MVNTILAKRVSHIVAKGSNPVWPKGSKSSGFSTYAYDGNINTHALMSQRNVGSPMADAVFALWEYGQSAYVPSIAELRLLNAYRHPVNAALVSIGGEPISDNPDECWYWSSTEVAGQETAKAWLYSLSQGAMQETPKTQSHKVRPIITLNN